MDKGFIVEAKGEEMKVIQCDGSAVRFHLRGKERFGDFIFDFNLIPLTFNPKHVVFEYTMGKHRQEFKIGWRKFVKQGMVGDTVIIARGKCAYFENGRKVWGRMT